MRRASVRLARALQQRAVGGGGAAVSGRRRGAGPLAAAVACAAAGAAAAMLATGETDCDAQAPARVAALPLERRGRYGLYREIGRGGASAGGFDWGDGQR